MYMEFLLLVFLLLVALPVERERCLSRTDSSGRIESLHRRLHWTRAREAHVTMRSISAVILVSALIVSHVSSAARFPQSAFQTSGLRSTRRQPRDDATCRAPLGVVVAVAAAPLGVVATSRKPRFQTMFQAVPRVLWKRPTLIKSTAFLAGIADVFCMSRHNCYANMMTGNTIKFATSASQLCLVDTAFFAALIASYLVGFGAYRIADQTVPIRRSAPTTSAHQPPTSREEGKEEGAVVVESRPPTTSAAIAPVVFGLFAFYDILWGSHFLSSSNKRWLVTILAVGSGMINSAAAESTGVVTGMMTGNMQKMANYFVDAMLHRMYRGNNNNNNNNSDSASYPKPSLDRLQGIRTSAKIVTSFLSGLVVASVGMQKNASVAALVTYGGKGFTALGAAYAVLLFLYSGPPIELSWKGRTKHNHNKVEAQQQQQQQQQQQRRPPCELDLYETECLVDDNTAKEEYVHADESDSTVLPSCGTNDLLLDAYS